MVGFSFQICRTKVECGGQCLINPSCDTFNYVSNVCKLLKSDLLFKDKTSTTEAYMLTSISSGKFGECWKPLYYIWIVGQTSSTLHDFLHFDTTEAASWTTWTSWEACRDDRLPNRGISATSSSHLCHISGSNAYIRRRRTCQNHVNTGLKYSRYGGLNECLGNHVSDSNGQNDWQDTRPCPGLATCPSKKHSNTQYSLG